MSIEKRFAHEECTIIKRNESIEPNHYQELDETYQPNKQFVICLGGNCTLSTKDANAVCKVGQRLMGLHHRAQDEQATLDDIDLIGVKYGKTYDRYGKEKNTSELCFKDVERITNQFLMPLIFKNNERLSLTEACKNITNVTFLSHSIGTKQVGKIISLFAKRMTECGYTKEETAEVIGNITSVAFAPETTVSSYLKALNPPDTPNPQQFNIKSVKDFPANLEYEHETGKKVEDFEGLQFVKSNLCNNEVTLFSSNFETGSSADEHMIHSVIHRSENWESTSWNKDEDGNHFFVSFKADAASQCAAYILSTSVANGVQNSLQEDFVPKPPIDKQIDDCKDIVSSQFENMLPEE